MKASSFARKLRGSKDWNYAREALSRDLADHPERAVEIAAALEDELAERGPDSAIRAIRRNLFEIVCRCRHASATPIAARLGSAGQGAERKPLTPNVRAHNAMQLAGTRPTPEVTQLLTDGALLDQDPEFGLLVLHELTLRGKAVDAFAAPYLRWAKEVDHPLSPLPAVLLDVESELPRSMPHYSTRPGNSGWPMVSTEADSYSTLGDLLSGLGAPAVVDIAAAAEPFTDWLTGSNGRLQVNAYVAGSSYPTHLPEPVLSAEHAARLAPVASLVRRLFIASNGGGAYTHGPGGAHARLRTWRALAALADAGVEPSIVEVAQKLARVRYIEIEPVDHWFDEVAWDIWFIVDDGQRIVTVAATDTD